RTWGGNFTNIRHNDCRCLRLRRRPISACTGSFRTVCTENRPNVGCDFGASRRASACPLHPRSPSASRGVVMSLRNAALLALALLAGCHRAAPPSGPPPTPTVTVARPVESRVTEYREYTGHTEAVETVEVRPRVRGILERI